MVMMPPCGFGSETGFRFPMRRSATPPQWVGRQFRRGQTRSAVGEVVLRVDQFDPCSAGGDEDWLAAGFEVEGFGRALTCPHSFDLVAGGVDDGWSAAD